MLGFQALTAGALTAAPAGLAVETITDTDILQLPINCILAGQQLYRESYREHEIFEPRLRATEVVSKGRGGRLKGGKPSFTTTTNKKGYD